MATLADMLTGYMLYNRGIVLPFPAGDKKFFLSKAPWPAVRRALIHWVQGALSHGVRRPGSEADHSYLIPKLLLGANLPCRIMSWWRAQGHISWGGWSALRAVCCFSEKRAIGTHRIGAGWALEPVLAFLEYSKKPFSPAGIRTNIQCNDYATS